MISKIWARMRTRANTHTLGDLRVEAGLFDLHISAYARNTQVLTFSFLVTHMWRMNANSTCSFY
jgi:hypothetical protein